MGGVDWGRLNELFDTAFRIIATFVLVCLAIIVVFGMVKLVQLVMAP
jgi:hypothetical protein